MNLTESRSAQYNLDKLIAIWPPSAILDFIVCVSTVGQCFAELLVTRQIFPDGLSGGRQMIPIGLQTIPNLRQDVG